MRYGHLGRAAALPFCLLMLWWLGAGWVAAAGADGLLRRGDQGSSVKTMQQQLLSLGYDIGMPDGDFGTQTEQAIRSFQRAAGLPVDGVAGPATLRALADAVSTYTVRAGDTLYGIARDSNTTVESLQRLNGLSGSVIVAGQQLLIPRAGAAIASASPTRSGRSSVKAVASEDPPSDGKTSGAAAEPDPVTQYSVKAGDTLTSIAREFGTNVAALQRVNPLADPDILQVGQQIRLPMEVAARGGRVYPGSLLWPVRGQISSGYGSRIHPLTGLPDFHEGIDIGVPAGTPVHAAASGTVVEADWMGGYGYGVVIEHTGGITTLYGHNTRLLVRPGEKVTAGDVIALSGSTGMSTGPHVDFRVKKDGKYQNPLLWLE